MANGELVTVQVERIATGGAGIARLGGKSVFVELTAPGESVRCRIWREHPRWVEADLIEVLKPSPLRITPPCPLYGSCGGCSLQHITYEAQLNAKATILTDAFKRIGGMSAPEIRVRASSPFEYRNRVQFHPLHDETANRLSIGFMERKSSRIIPLDDCPIAASGIRKALQEGKIIPPEDDKRFTVYSHGATLLVEGKQERGEVTLNGKRLALDVRCFFQSNAAMLELLISDVKEAAVHALAHSGENARLADIYCGVGTFAAFLSDGFPPDLRFSGIDLVEAHKPSLTLARENVQGNDLKFHACTDTEWAKTAVKRNWAFMVLDPPRNGLSKQFAQWLTRHGSAHIAYVSCDPATLARDSRTLCEGGYSLESLTLYDFYPQTAHIESLALFSRSKQA